MFECANPCLISPFSSRLASLESLPIQTQFHTALEESATLTTTPLHTPLGLTGAEILTVGLVNCHECS